MFHKRRSSQYKQSCCLLSLFRCVCLRCVQGEATSSCELFAHTVRLVFARVPHSCCSGIFSLAYVFVMSRRLQEKSHTDTHTLIRHFKSVVVTKKRQANESANWIQMAYNNKTLWTCSAAAFVANLFVLSASGISSVYAMHVQTMLSSNQTEIFADKESKAKK